MYILHTYAISEIHVLCIYIYKCVCVHAFGDGKGFLGGGVCFYMYILFFPGDLAEMPAQMGCRMEDTFLKASF